MSATQRAATTAGCDGRGGLRDSIELALVSSLEAPATARAAVARWMAGYAGATLVADAELIVGELVANSVRHAAAPGDAVISVRALAQDGVLRLEVADRGDRGSVVRRAPDLERGGGFGLNLVEMLTRRWGVDRSNGTRVWAELALSANAEIASGRHGEADDGARTS